MTAGQRLLKATSAFSAILRGKDAVSPPQEKAVITTGTTQPAPLTADPNKLNEIIYHVIGNGLVVMSDDPRNYVKDGYGSNSDVYSIINKIARRASAIPWQVYEVVNKNAAKRYHAAMEAKDMGAAYDFKAQAWKPVENRDITPLMDEPNELQSWAEIIEENIGYMLSTGNGYFYTLKATGFPVPTSLFNLPAHFVQIELPQGSNYFHLSERRYYLDIDQRIPFNGDEIYHRKYWNPALQLQDFVYGMSPIKAAKKVVTRSNDSYDAGVEALQNRGLRGIISQGAGAGEDGGFLEPKDVDKLASDFDKKNFGKGKYGKILATSAFISWQEMGLSPVDLGLIEMDGLNLTALCNVYGVPVQMFNDTSASTDNNMEVAEAAFYIDAVIPQLVSLRNTFNKMLAKPASKSAGKELWIDFDLGAIPSLQSAMAKMSERYRAEFELGLITGNEYRIRVGSDASTIKDKDMDTHWTPNKLKPKPAEVTPK